MNYRQWLGEERVALEALVEPSLEGLLDLFIKPKRPDFHSDPTPSLHTKNDKALRKTYLNENWLRRQTYHEGLIELGAESVYLSDRGKTPTKLNDLLRQSVNQLQQQLKHYYREQKRLVAGAPKTIAALEQGEAGLTEEAFAGLGSEPKLFETPKTMYLKLDLGGFDNKGKPVESMADLTQYLKAKDPIPLPALGQDGVRLATAVLVDCFNHFDAEVDDQMGIYFSFFGQLDASPRYRNPVPKSNPWHDYLLKIDACINQGYSPSQLYMMQLIRVLSRLIDRSIK